MKTLILTVGSAGSGKSTWAKKFIDRSEHWVYVSQDEQGRDGHIIKFNVAIALGQNVIVDRMNFSPEQRKPYIELAKKSGYKVIVKYFNLPYKFCLNRMLNRENHPTIKKGDLKTCREVLDMYWEKEYLFGIDKEVDEVLHNGFISGLSNKKVLNLDGLIYHNKIKHFFTITDPHACFDDAMAMLKHMGYVEGLDLLIIIGDLNDRGEQADLMMEWALNTPLVFSILGNHDIKIRKWLRGNKVKTESLEGTIAQLTAAGMIDTQEQKDELYYKMMEMPYIIKAGMNYFSHAGFHPYSHPEATSREFCLFARHFDSAMGTFTRETTAAMWFTFPRRYPEYNLFFGHIVQEKMPVLEDKKIFAMDGGICFGETNRGAKITLEGNKVEIFEIPSTRPLRVKDDKWDYMNKFEPYDERVKKGLLRKVEKGDLVLYNYTDACTYEKAWDKYTMESRGLILDKNTGMTIARPFPKFFNLGELENKTLPQPPYHESYTVEDKLDGSLGIMYRDPADDKFKIATRGSFNSDQAIKGSEILDRALDKIGILPIVDFATKYTPLFEIIYPENRVNDGARLVCNYGNTETLVLLAAIDKVSGKDATEAELKDFADTLHFPLRQVYKYTLEEVVAMQKTLPVTQEGFVIKFKSGFRVKVKGDEYCKMQRILNGINPLAIWEKMCESEQFLLSAEYKKHIPEEIIGEVDALETRLRMKWAKKIVDFQYEYVKLNLDTPRELGMYAHNPANSVSLELMPALFMIQSKRFKDLFKYVAKSIRPTNNKIE